MSFSTTKVLKRLINIPSVNPLDQEVGRRSPGDILGEAGLTEHLRGICEELGLPWYRQPVHPGRENLITCLPGNPSATEGGELMLWEVHQDTVSVEGMTIDPFGGEAQHGRIYGRGACDVKGGMAAMITALSRLVEDRPPIRPTILLAFTVNEEYGFTGAKALSRLWTNSQLKSQQADPGTGSIAPLELFPRKPDAAIVAEPTGLNIVVTHKGYVRWYCHTLGTAGHTSQPDKATNAIYTMARVVQAFQRYDREVAASLPSHPLCGRATVCVSMISAGHEINTIPAQATIAIDRRLAPDEDPRAAYDEMIDYVASNVDSGSCQIVHDEPIRESRGLTDELNGPLASQMATIVQSVYPPSHVVGAPYGTDAAAIGATGVPTVVFGPGSVDQAHTTDEWIAIDQLELATEAFYQLGTRSLSRPERTTEVR